MNEKMSLVVRACSRTGEVLRLLNSVGRQSRKPNEVVVIDSGSIQSVRDRLRDLRDQGIPVGSRHDQADNRGGGDPIPLKLIDIPQTEYQSARALNQAIAETNGALVGIISQDALPADERCLERLASAFETNEVAGAYGRQILPSRCDPLGEKDLATSYPVESRLQVSPDCWFANSCSMIRRDLWKQVPFEELAVISEDHLWAKRMQSRGYMLKYQADAVVFHYHDYRRVRDVWQRFFQEGRGLAYVHGRRPNVWRAVNAGTREIVSDGLWLAKRGMLAHWWKALARRVVKHTALYWGFRRGFAGPRAQS
jgi:GT2 family glycosyltransferase